MKLSKTQHRTLEIAAKRAVYRHEARGIWQVDRDVAGEPYVGNVFANTQRSLESHGLVEVTTGLRVCPYRRVFGAEDPRVAVQLLILTEAGERQLGISPPKSL